MEKKEQEVAGEYLSSLADLNLNSKPLINMLTILAEENIEFAPVIVKAVEQHITKVSADVKLPVLYLIDSIVKNVGREYIQLFSHSIVNIFCGVFEKVNEKIREKMYTLRQTWNDVFTPQKLYTLDVKVNCMDPNWPITAKVVPKSPAIHVNPNFLKNKGEPLNEMEAKLRHKQRQLLELQKRKLELELAATKQRLEEQEKQLQSTITSTAAPTPAPATTPVIPVKPALIPTNKTSQPAPPVNAAAPTATPANNVNGPKIRVAPVNSALLNSIRQRDPRLARQQQQQQQAALAAASQNAASIPSTGAVEVSIAGQVSKAVTEPPVTEGGKDATIERNLPKIPQKYGYGISNRDKSRSAYGENASGGVNISSRRAAMQRTYQDKSSSVDGKKSPNSNATLSPSLSSGRNERSNKSHSSSARSGGSSRSSGRESSKNHREKSSSSSSHYDRERKRKIETSSPSKSSDKIASPHKQSEKSPKRYTDSSSKMTKGTGNNNIGTGPMSPNKFRDISKHIRSRNYMRRNREKSPSPKIPTPPPPTTTSHDTDLRESYIKSSSSPEKRAKISQRPIDVGSTESNTLSSTGSSAITSTISTTMAVTTSTFKINESTDNVANSSPLVTASVTSSNCKTEKLEKNIDATASASAKDIDLRHLHPTPPTAAIKAPISSAVNTSLDTPKLESSEDTKATEENEVKKRSASDPEDVEGPVTKKTKSEKIDSLFGTEDVDLRTLSAPGSHLGIGAPSAMPSTPPPPPIISNESENWAKVKGTKSTSKQLLKSRLDDVRAKLAKAAKGDKLERDLKAFKKGHRFDETHEDSQDGTDNNIRTIISQAQEMLQTDNMDVDQYNTLVKTVIQINETSKLKEAQRRESLLKKKDDSTDLTPISDEEDAFDAFGSDDESGLKASKSKILAKRIPKIKKIDETTTSSENKFEQSSVLRRSPSPNNENSSNSYSDNNRNQGMSKFEHKRGRQKDTKWSGSGWSESQQNNAKQKWPMGNNNFRPNISNQQNMMNRGSVPSPWNQPSQMIFAAPLTQSQIPPPPPIPPLVNPLLPPELTTVTPGPPMPPPILMPHLSNSVDNPNADVVRTINIDGVPKEIRFYDEMAIAFMDWDQPKEIGFQSGQRRIMVDEKDIITLSFNDAYKTVSIDGQPHKMRFGCPTRELYVDGNWFECYFGDPPIRIVLDGRMRVFKVEGPAPQVRIGNIRQDLVVGKINMIIDALIIVPVFLDAKIQSFQLDDTIHSLQFADCLKTVLIDNVPFDVEYGGLPKSLLLNGVKHFVRFGTLPNGIVPGAINIQNMIHTEKFNSIELPNIPAETHTGVVGGPIVAGPFAAESLKSELNSASPDLKTMVPIAGMNGEIKDSSDDKKSVLAAPMPSSVGNLNIDELFQKLLSSGILNQNQNATKAEDSKKDKQKETQIMPIDLSRPETIKTRQAGLIQKLFSGMQCSSCGVRFPPEQTMKYSQHLDWHFRQNRKERDNSRRAHSRKWYYDVSDWIQYEEIEDLEEREKNWFESQQNEAENVEENSNQRINSPPPSCPAGPDDVDKNCDMCHDKFEQFYNEESEEWHLRDAIRVEEKIYHPICYEDYKASLTFDDSAQANAELDDNAMDTTVVKPEIDGEEDKTAEVIDADDDEDDVIVLPTEEPSITEIPDDDEDVIIETSLENEILVPDSETSRGDEKTGEKSTKDVCEIMESDDVEIQEPHIPFTDLDTYEETVLPSVSTVDDSSQSSQMVVKIKEEPKDDGYNEDDAFEEVDTIICDDDISTQTNESVTEVVSIPAPAPAPAPVVVRKPPVTSSSNSNIVVLHDPTATTNNNEDPTPATTTTTTTGMNRIKININKSAIRSENRSTATTTATSGRIETSEETSGTNENTNTKSTDEDDFYKSIEFSVKSSLQNVQFKKVPKTISGVDTSGLCSIM